MVLVVRVATAIVRTWTRAYTSGLPAHLRDARRDEIDSDLWESAHDLERSPAAVALQMIARMVIGLPDDVGWRSEQVSTQVSRRWTVALTLGVLAIVALWLVTETGKPAEMPDIRQLRFTNTPALIDAPPPPPPPPPPCPPDGYPRDPAVRCAR